MHVKTSVNRIISLLLAVMLAIGGMSVTVFAAQIPAPQNVRIANNSSQEHYTIIWDAEVEERNVHTVIYKDGVNVLESTVVNGGYIDPRPGDTTYDIVTIPVMQALGDGEYYATVQFKADYHSDSPDDSDIVTSNTVTYHKPSDKLDAPTNLRWEERADGLYMVWDSTLTYDNSGGSTGYVFYVYRDGVPVHDAGDNIGYVNTEAYVNDRERKVLDFFFGPEKLNGNYTFAMQTRWRAIGTKSFSDISELSGTYQYTGGNAPATPNITITAHPDAKTTVDEGSIAGALSVTATASEGASPSYQWYSNTSATNAGGTAISGETGANFTIPDNLTTGVWYFYCEVSATGAASVCSNVAKVIVNPQVPSGAPAATPSVTSPDPIQLDMDGVKTAYIGVSLGMSSANPSGTGIFAEQATVTETGDAVTASPATITTDGNIKVTAVQKGTAIIKIAFSGGNVTDDSYDKSITVNVAGPDQPPAPPSYIPSSGGGSSDGSNSGGNTYTPTTAAPSNTPAALTTAQANSAVQAALNAAKAAGSTTVKVRMKNISSVSLATLQAMQKTAGTTPLKFSADSMSTDGKSVDVRITLDPAKTTKGLNLSASTTSSRAKNTETNFEKWFNNNVSVVSLGQRDSFGQEVEIAAKIDPKLDTKTLLFYSYHLDATTGKYVYIKIENPQYWSDQNGYVHFTTTMAGEIIITDKPLAKK